MAYVLQDLLKIRLMREDRAAGELTAARDQVRLAEKDVAERERELHEYELTKEARRDRIYAAVMGRTVSRDEIDLAQEGVARIDEEGILKADNVVQAKRELEKKEELVRQAQDRFSLASRNRMKIDEHKLVWLEEERAFEEHRAESELEDFTVRKIDDD